MRDGVLKCVDINICKKGETLDVAALICRVTGHLYIVVTDSLALDITEVDGLFLGIFTDDLHNREAIGMDQVGINRRRCQGRAIQLHTHTLLLRSLADEGIDCSWLRLCHSAVLSRTFSPR